MLFGHGPIIQDHKAVLDPQAVLVVPASGVPVILIPYAAARQVSMTASDLDRVTRMGAAGWCVAERSRASLEFWRSKTGPVAFYPVDLMAVACVRDPTHFGFALLTAWVGEGALLPCFGGGPALLGAYQTGLTTTSTATAHSLYCDVVRVQVYELFS